MKIITNIILKKSNIKVLKYLTMDYKKIYREEKNKDVYTVELMEQRVEHFSNEYVKWLEEQLTLTDVSQQRGQLKAYAELIQKDYTNHFFDDAVDESIDKFLSL